LFIILIADEINFCKKKSKISIFAEELTKEIKEYDKQFKEEIIEENFYDDFNYEENTNIFYKEKNKVNDNKKFTVYFYLELNKNNYYIFPIESDLLNINTQYGYDLIENIINKINNKSIVVNNNSMQYIFSLKNCENNNNKNFYMENYELRLCKKNLKPNFELPPFFSSILLKNILNEKLSLICHNNLYIMLLEKEGDDHENENEKENENNNEKEDKIKIRIKKENIKYDKGDNYNCKKKCILF
jgi:hypothetical protein